MIEPVASKSSLAYQCEELAITLVLGGIQMYRLVERWISGTT
jgi:hypothetical protein